MAGQVWSTNTAGGFLAAPKLSKKLREAVKSKERFRQFADVKDASMQGKGNGDTFLFDVYSNVATRGGQLAEGTAMPETGLTIRQGQLKITEYGNSIPFTGKVQDLSEQDIENMINKVLKDDAAKTLDAAAFEQFALTPLVVGALGGTDTSRVELSTTGLAPNVNNVAFTLGHAKNIVDIMKERNIPAYEGDDYVALAWPSTLRPLKNDLEGVAKYTTTGFAMVMRGEVGRYDGFRYVEQTAIAHGGADDSTTYSAMANVADAWDNGKSDWIYFFGADTVAEAIAVPEEIRGKIPTDYGRSKGVAWYALTGFGIVHTDAAQARIVKWGSQA